MYQAGERILLSRDSFHSFGIVEGRGHFEPFSVFLLPSHDVWCDRDHKPVLDTDLSRLQLCALTMDGMVSCLGNPKLPGSSGRCPQWELGSSGPSAMWLFTSLSLHHILPMHVGSASPSLSRQTSGPGREVPPI